MEYIGRAGSLVFFANETLGAVVDDVTNVVVASGPRLSMEKTAFWENTDEYQPSEALSTLAHAAVSSLNIEVFSNSDRMHTIPKSVVAEAKRALEWRKEHKRGGTSVGLNTARTLADGGQIGIKKIRHIAKYFPRHEVDKKGKGYKPGGDGYPSNGRIAWALWGGDAAKKWATAIVERENKKSVTAGADFMQPPSGIELEDFSNEEVRFVVRVRKNSGFDRLYRINALGNVAVWDDGCWENLGNIENDIDTYDIALDDPYDKEEKRHIPVDAKTAVSIAALFDSNPFSPVSIADIAPREWEMFANAKHELEWDVLSLIAAAGERDGNYTPEERSKNVKSQTRDKQGRFAEKGGRVQVGKNPLDRGVIVEIEDETGMATVKLDNGATVKVSVSDTQKEDPSKPTPPPVPQKSSVDTSGILGQSKQINRKSIAELPKKLPIIHKEELHEILANFSASVQTKRDKARIDALISSAEKPGKDDYKNPKESDVDPLYFAIVAQDDPQAVMEVVALVPSGPSSNAPMTFKRSPGQWERDDSVLKDLNSATPPPVVQLDLGTLEEVMKQVDSAVTAGGNVSMSRVNARRMKNYWLRGEGAEKIRWKQDGSRSRCVDHMAKYLGPYAKGYCALRHREATGSWVDGDYSSKIIASGAENFNNYFVNSEESIIENSILYARLTDAKNRVIVAGGGQVEPPAISGAKFFIPLVIPEGLESGDGRIFDKNSIDLRELPLPLLWQIKTGEGHNGSVVVGRIDYMEKTDDGIGNARGVFDSGTYGQEAERLVRGGFIRGVSADLDKFEASEESKPSENSEEDDVSTGRIKISKARVMAVTLVPKPAFQECTIKITEDDQEDEVVPDGVYVEDVDPSEASALVACGITAGVIPTTPPSAWFENPKLDKATPLTVDDEGRVFGHIAAWHVDHIGMSFGTKPPRSRSGYSYFHTGVVRTEEGNDAPVGQLTLAGGHASLELNASQAVRHYDDTASAIADVHAGEDSYGIWVAGALRPGTTPEQIRALRASAPSGDWRPIKGHLELVAVCQVNVPGFPIARSRVASGQVMALVAAGASVLAHMKSDPVAELQARIDRLERKPLEMAADSARQRVLSAKVEELANKVKKTKEEIEEDDFTWMLKKFDGDTDEEDAEAESLAVISAEERRRLIQEGKALKDGSFPIRNWKDLKKAVKAYAKAPPEDRTRAKKHIIRRAKALRRERMLPERWVRKRDTYSVEECPPATQDIALNLKNRKNAIDTAMYGPLNPEEPNEEYWQEIASEWNVDAETAKQQRCGNCAVFVVSPSMKDCIATGLTGESNDEFDSIDSAGELGYCESFDFKCASARTCRAWVGGGPVTAAAKKTGARTPAPKKDQIKGSDKNKPGSADGTGSIKFSEKTEKAISNKVEEHNKTAPDGRKTTSATLKAVYRRGAGAYSVSHRPGMSRDGWAMARVNAYLKLLKSGKPANSAYKQDNDLLPASHPKSSKKDNSVLTASSLVFEDDDSVTAAADGPCWDGYKMVGWKMKNGKKVPNCVPVDSSADTDDQESTSELDASIEEFKYFSPEQREKLAKEGKALSDGSYPIETSTDLKNAIWAYGRSRPEKRAEVKSHIVKRAEDLDLKDMLPDIWTGEGSSFSDEDEDELSFSIRERLDIVKSVVAAGGLDRNRGNAEKLRRYWTRGPGALKIRWGTPGDWKRCVRHLAKYMGPRAKGYCQLRHKEATGVYTGSRLNPGRKKTSIMESAEFTLSEALFHDGEYVETTITSEDLETPLEWICSEEDPYFDASWEPDEGVAQLCELVAANLDDWADEDLDSNLKNEEDSIFYDDATAFSLRKDKDKNDIPDDLTPEEIEALRMEKVSRTRDLKVKKKGKYTPQTQPRDSVGKFRQVLARLKLDLGTAGLNKAIEKVEEIENLDFSGDYGKAVEASEDLINIIDRVDIKAINPESIDGIREGSRALGETIANLPFAFGEQSEKIRYSDVPPALQTLMKDMIRRVEEKIGKEDADDATAELRTFMSGGDYFSQADISSQMSKLLRLLT